MGGWRVSRERERKGRERYIDVVSVQKVSVWIIKKDGYLRWVEGG